MVMQVPRLRPMKPIRTKLCLVFGLATSVSFVAVIYVQQTYDPQTAKYLDLVSKMGINEHVEEANVPTRSTPMNVINGTASAIKMASTNEDCVINPAMDYARYFSERTKEPDEWYGKLKPECPPRNDVAHDPNHGFPIDAYVLSLDRPGATERYEARRDFLAPHGIRLHRFMAVDGAKEFGQNYSTNADNQLVYTDPVTNTQIAQGSRGFLTPGERGYAASMYKLFSELSQPGRNVRGNVLVVDDDVVFDCKFQEKLTALLSERRCSTMILPNSDPPGALLLGSAVWISGSFPRPGVNISGWLLSDADMQAVHNRSLETMVSSPDLPMPKRPQCFNAHAQVFGSFAVMYHSSLFEPIMEWIKTSGANMAYDTVYPFLSDQGFIVRVAHPPLAIQDLRHASSVNEGREDQTNMRRRASVHRWGDLSRFCDPKNGTRLLVK